MSPLRNAGFFLVLLLSLATTAQVPKLIQPEGHISGIDMLEYSPDGKYIVTASRSRDDRIARVWEVASGKLVYNLSEHMSQIRKVQFSADGQYILTHAIVPYLWDFKTGTLVTLVDSVRVADISFSPDGKSIVYSREEEDSLVIWDVASRSRIKLIGSSNEYDNISYSNDGKKLVSYIYFGGDSGDSSTIQVWDIASGSKIIEQTCERGSFKKASFSHSNKMVAVNTTAQIYLFDLEKGSRITLFEYDLKDTDHAVFSAGDDKLIYTYKNTVHVWSIRDDSMVVETEERDVWLTAMTLSPDSMSLIAIDNEGFLLVYDSKTGEKKLEKRVHPATANGLTISPDGKQLATFSYDNTVSILRTGDFGLQRSITGSGSGLRKVLFTSDSTRMIAADNNYRIRITEVASGKLLHTLSGHSNEIADFQITPDSKILISNGYDSSLRIWDIETARELYSIRATSYHFYNFAIHPSSSSFVAWEALDNKISFWDLESGKLKATQTVTSTSYTAHAMQYSPDGKYLLLNEGGDLQVRDGLTGKLIKNLPGSKSAITKIDVSADSRLVAAVADSIVTVWDIATAKKMISQKGITAPYYNKSLAAPSHNAVQFSPDGKQLVAGSDDATAKIFDVKTGKQTMMLDSVHYRSIVNVFFTSDGKKIITLGKEGFATIWDAATGDPLRAIGSFSEDIADIDLHPDNRYLVMAAGSSLGLYNIDSRALLYKTFFVNDRDWLVVDSAQRYDGTEGARKLLYFTCGTEIIELDQLKDQLWVPDLGARITKQETISSKSLKELDICGLTPQIENRSVSTGYHYIITPRRGGLGETILLVNGIEVRRYNSSQLEKNGNSYELKISKDDLKDLLIDGRENSVIVKAYTNGNSISSRGVIINEDKTKMAAAAPNLYAVMVGISDYKGNELDLKYAAKDATDISATLGNAARKLLNTDGKEHVFMYNLTTAADRYLLPEKNSIKKTLEEIGKKATANDILLLFFAGHGVMEGEKKQFYFLTADASKTSAAEAVKDVGISTAELTEWIKPQTIKAQKRILIFDACNSGQAIKDFVQLGNGDQNYLAARNDDKAQQVKAIDKLNEKSGLFILSASASNQNAYEMGRYSQGLLTYSLLKAIKQQPDILDDGKYLDVSRWFNAAEKTVTELSKESGARQEPQIVTNTNFSIGIVDDEVMAKINLPQEKPLFAASNFQNNDEAVADDDLELSKMINLQLSDIATRGTDSRIVYVTATNSPDAFTLSGRYEIKGTAITVKVNIKQKKEIKYRFEVNGTTTKLGELAVEVAAKAAGMVK
ncbi:MAG: caspase family protein [Bacteroidota bacterium]|nr:caspase family protein [Bacteroidota bacterium]